MPCNGLYRLQATDTSERGRPRGGSPFVFRNNDSLMDFLGLRVHLPIAGAPFQ